MTQYFSTIVSSANAIAAITGTTQQVASLTLKAGQWVVDGELWAGVVSGSPTILWVRAAASTSMTVSATDPADNVALNVLEPNQPKQATTTVGWVLPLSPMYLNITTATTVYLKGQISWTGTGAMSLYGKIAARGTPASGIVTSGNFVYLHLADGSDEGYVNMAMAQLLSPNAAGGTRIRVENRVINVIEAASDILGALS